MLSIQSQAKTSILQLETAMELRKQGNGNAIYVGGALQNALRIMQIVVAQDAPAPLSAPTHDGWWWFRGRLYTESVGQPVFVLRGIGQLNGVEENISDFDGEWWPLTPPTQEE